MSSIAAQPAASSGLGPVYAVLSLHTLLAAGTYLVAKGAFSQWMPMELAWLRFTLASAVYVAIFSVTGRKLLPPRELWPRLLGMGLVALPINQGVFLYGLSLSSAAHASILYALTPACVLLGARVILGEPLTRMKALGVSVAFSGVCVILLEKGLASAAGALVGDLLILVAVLAWALYTVRMRPLTQQHGVLTTTGWVSFAGALLTLPLGPWLVRPAAELAHISPAGWAGLAYIVCITSVVAYLLWSFALRRLEAARVAIFTNLQPVVTALVAWALLGEPITLPTLLGGGLVITGVTLLQRR